MSVHVRRIAVIDAPSLIAPVIAAMINELPMRARVFAVPAEVEASSLSSAGFSAIVWCPRPLDASALAGRLAELTVQGLPLLCLDVWGNAVLRPLARRAGAAFLPDSVDASRCAWALDRLLADIPAQGFRGRPGDVMVMAAEAGVVARARAAGQEGWDALAECLGGVGGLVSGYPKDPVMLPVPAAAAPPVPIGSLEAADSQAAGGATGVAARCFYVTAAGALQDVESAERAGVTRVVGGAHVARVAGIPGLISGAGAPGGLAASAALGVPVGLTAPASLAASAGLAGASDELPALSPREEDILRLYGAGVLLKSIAYEMGLSINTVKTYRLRIREKYERVGVILQQRLEFHRAARLRFPDFDREDQLARYRKRSRRGVTLSDGSP